MGKTQWLKLSVLLLVAIGGLGLAWIEFSGNSLRPRRAGGERPSELALENQRLHGVIAQLRAENDRLRQRHAVILPPPVDEVTPTQEPLVVHVITRPGAGAALTWLRDALPVRHAGAEFEDMEAIQSLDLTDIAIDAEQAGHLAHFPRLIHLDLTNTGFTDAAAAQLGACPQLERLVLANNPIGDPSLRWLAELRELRVLSLAGTAVTDEGVALLAGLEHLSEFRLDRTRVSDAALASLASTPLKVLGLARTEVTNQGLVALAGHTLEVLDLADVEGVTEGGLKHLVGQSQLRRLNLRGIAVTVEGIAPVTELTRLTHLDLGLVASDRVVAQLDQLAELEYLNLHGTIEVTDAALVHVGLLSSLRDLYLQYTAISDVGLAELADLSDLRVLDLRGTDVSDNAVLGFRTTHAGCHVLR